MFTTDITQDEELERYKSLDFNHNDYHASIEAKNTIHDKEIDTLLKRWRYPSLSLHGIGNGNQDTRECFGLLT
jgi:Cys-Gly metallodipeptidase DUG1